MRDVSTSKTNPHKGPGRIWRSDAFMGLLAVLAVFALHTSTDLFAGLERRFYDMASSASSRQPSDRIAVIAIDDQSIANIGRWPWPREVHAELIDQLSAANDLAYIAMEFLSGRDLVDNTRDGHLLPVTTVLSIGERVALALHHAHRQQVVHRDIKPANVMYDPATDGVKVTDFGIARITGSSKTRTGMVLGTPSFMSPEQLAGQRVDGRSDLYSLGVSLFQLLTGVLPLRGDSLAALMYQIANEPAPDVRALRPELPRELADILSKALTKSPAQRYQTGEELATDLRKVIALLSTSTVPEKASGLAGGDDKNAMLATVVTPAPTPHAVPESASPDLRL